MAFFVRKTTNYELRSGHVLTLAGNGRFREKSSEPEVIGLLAAALSLNAQDFEFELELGLGRNSPGRKTVLTIPFRGRNSQLSNLSRLSL